MGQRKAAAAYMKVAQNLTESNTFICSCGCKSQLLIQFLNNGQLTIDTRSDGRHRWVGVVLSETDSEFIRKALAS